MTRVLITAPFPAHLMDKLQVVSAEIELEQIALPKQGWPADKSTSAEVLYAIGGTPRPELAPNLRWIQTHSAGVDHLHAEPIWTTDIFITTASGIHAPNLGQYAMAQILTWANHVPRWLYYQQQHEWPKERWQKFVPEELRGQTLGILGYGSVGREIARLGKAFGMTVLATKADARTIKDGGYAIIGTGDPDGYVADRLYPSEATRMMVAECDYIVITLPLTTKTFHFIDETMIRAMKPNCFLINISRGPIINEIDLIKGLRKGWIAGVGLDVFETEPLPSDSPLWSLENAVISPHIGGFTPHYDDRVTDLFAENLRRYLAGETLINLVNRDTGY